MDCSIMIVGIDGRWGVSHEVEQVLLRHGHSIKTRLGIYDAEFAGELTPAGMQLGLHEPDPCCGERTLVLQLMGEKKQLSEFEAALGALKGVKAKLVIMD